jgi:hypothetical protein
VVDPTADSCVEFGEADGTGAVVFVARPQTPTGKAHFARLDQTVVREHDEPQPSNADGNRRLLGTRFVHGKAQ